MYDAFVPPTRRRDRPKTTSPSGASRARARGATRPRRTAATAAGGPLLALHLLLAGCVTSYQPMSGLHRPVAIDTDYANFADLSLTLHCLAGPVLDASQARDLCRKLSRLFENQGCAVETRTSTGRPSDSDEAPGAGPARTALNMRLSSRLIHEVETDLILWSYWTDYTFAQDVVVTDETGFLLVQETLTGRFVTRLGFFSDTEEDFSSDYYGQVSQLALNAKMRRQVLRESAQPGEAD